MTSVSHEGFVFVVRIAMVLLLILVGALVRTFAGPSKRRGVTMDVGGLVGLALGVTFSYLVPASLKMEQSISFAICGMLLGFGVAWLFARRIPREA
jgi:hypothetical protein